MKKLALLLGAAFALTAFTGEAEAQYRRRRKKRPPSRYGRRRPGRRPGRRRYKAWAQFNAAMRCMQQAKLALRRRNRVAYNRLIAKARIHLARARMYKPVFRPGRPGRPGRHHRRRRYQGKYRKMAAFRMQRNDMLVRQHHPFRKARRYMGQYNNWQGGAKRSYSRRQYRLALVKAKRAFGIIKKAMSRKWAAYARKRKRAVIQQEKQAEEAAAEVAADGVKPEDATEKPIPAAPAAPAAAAAAPAEDLGNENETAAEVADTEADAEDKKAEAAGQ